MIAADTIASAMDRTRQALRTAGIPNPGLDARLIVAHALGLSDSALLGRPQGAVTADQMQDIDRLCRRRSAGEPLAYILGMREFFSLPLRVTPATLIPRPDSETLVEATLDCIADRGSPLRILDLGTGSGCLLLALLVSLPQAWGVGVDRSPDALAVARGNAQALGIGDRAAFLCCDWTEAIGGRFDLILANPPYVREDEWPNLATDVRAFEPRLALVGGQDGLVAFRRIIPQLSRLLAADGRVVLEIGCGQAAAVSSLIAAADLQLIHIKSDLAGIPRCVVAAGRLCAGARKSLECRWFPTSVGFVVG